MAKSVLLSWVMSCFEKVGLFITPGEKHPRTGRIDCKMGDVCFEWEYIVYQNKTRILKTSLEKLLKTTVSKAQCFAIECCEEKRCAKQCFEAFCCEARCLKVGQAIKYALGLEKPRVRGEKWKFIYDKKIGHYVRDIYYEHE
jgi:hypothetical protein